MHHLLTNWQREKHDEFAAFVASFVAPHAEQWDHDERIPGAVIASMAQCGYLGSLLPPEHGGRGWDVVTFGLMNEAFGSASSALTGVLTVQAMVSMSLLKWGTAEQRRAWLPALARGDVIGAFAVTEPGAGSSLRSIDTEFVPCATGFRLNGTKRWISCAQFAGLFLVFGRAGDQFVACVLPRETPGLNVEPIDGLMGFRAAGLAQVQFDDVEVPANNMVGKPGFALSHIAPVGLHYGRISTACSALGLLRGCFEQSVAYASVRKIGDQVAGDIGMVKSLLARMGTDLEAARFLCLSACSAEDNHLPDVFEQALMAKYFTSRAAVRAASDAVQIRGASGCHASSPVSRYYRDAKIMEVIEGTTQVHEDMLGQMFVGHAGRSASHWD